MNSIDQPGGDMPDNLPLLTQLADEDALEELPTLTEVITEEQAEPATGLQPDTGQETPTPETVIPVSCTPDEEQMQRLQQQLEIHLENVFAHKLCFHIEQLQRQAVERAVEELKAELPELLRDALNIHPGL